jgi:L-fuconolactonase
MWRAGVSALVTEAGEDWTRANLQPYRQHIHHEFGAGRIMWGSGWLGVRLRSEYDIRRATALELTDALSSDEKARAFGGTAADFYSIC